MATKFKRSKVVDGAVKDIPPSSSSTTDTLDIEDLVDSAKKHISGVFLPRDEYEPLLEVTDWIIMPKPIQDIIGVPGLPCGLIAEVMGKKDCGKTTFATEAAVSTQRDGGIAILIDTENKYNLKRAAAMGLDVKKLVIVKAKTIEEAFDKFVAMINLIKSKREYVNKATGEIIKDSEYEAIKEAKDKKRWTSQLKYAHRKVCAIWDSLGATPCEAELNESVTDFSMNAAKAIKGRLRKTLYYIKDTRCSLVLINQVYGNTNKFGKKTTPYGGSGPEYHCALILELVVLNRIRPPGVKAADGDFCGINTQIEAVKNHLGQPFKTGEVQIDWRGFVVDRDPEYAPEGFYKKEEVNESSGDKKVSRATKGRVDGAEVQA